MTKHVTRMARALTAATSRRGFLGRLARLAGGAAAGVAGMLAASTAHAKPGNGPNGGKPTTYCCVWWNEITGELDASCAKSKSEEPCPPKLGDWWLLGTYRVAHCRDCTPDLY